MNIDDISNSEANLRISWNFEAHHEADVDVNGIDEERILNPTQVRSNKGIQNIPSKKSSAFQKPQINSKKFKVYELEEPKIALNLSNNSLDNQNNFYISDRKSLKKTNDVMKVQRPFSSQSKKRKKLTLFQPSPQPPILTGPVTYYKVLEKIDKQLQREFDETLKRKETKRQMKSPYKVDYVRLRADSVRSSRNQLQINEKISRRQRWNECHAYRQACEEEFESERRHCKIDYVSKTYRELRIIGI